jgi:hypothetical protein
MHTKLNRVERNCKIVVEKINTGTVVSQTTREQNLVLWHTRFEVRINIRIEIRLELESIKNIYLRQKGETILT